MKYWFITGISSGLGKALAEAVIQQGDFVIGTFRKEKQVEAYNAKNKGNGFAVLLDITDGKKLVQVVGDLITKFGKIDVLVNNAGVGFAGAIEESSTEEIKAVIDVNFYATLNMTKAVLPYMRSAGSGCIVQISSHGGVKAFAGFGIYNASKFAVEGFSEALAQELAPLNIHVLIVEPGPFRTEFAGEQFGMAAKQIEAYSNTAGIFRNKIKKVNGQQEGDPHLAAKAIINSVYSDKKTQRLPLGKIALKTIGMKIDHLKADLEANKLIAESVVF